MTFKRLKRWMEQVRSCHEGMFTFSHQSVQDGNKRFRAVRFIIVELTRTLQRLLLDVICRRTAFISHLIPTKTNIHMSCLHSHKGLQCGSKFLSLDRKLYVSGGRLRRPTWDAKAGQPKSNVYVLDLATKQWKQCANMSEPRRGKVAAAALKGRIYVFGGLCAKSFCPISACDVYDPKIDAWSPMKPMPSCRYSHKVAKMGDERFVYGGKFCPDVTQLIHLSGHMREPSISAVSDRVRFLDVYHPVKDEWRRFIPFDVSEWDTVFTARGKFHRMNPGGIDVYDMKKDTWSRLRTFQDVPKEVDKNYWFPDTGSQDMISIQL